MNDAPEQFDVSVKQARELLPGRPAIQTVIRWMTRGVRGCLLRSQPCGHRRFTSAAAIADFLADQRQAAPVESAKYRGARQLARDSKRADEAMERLGVRNHADRRRAKKKGPASVAGPAVRMELGAPSNHGAA